MVDDFDLKQTMGGVNARSELLSACVVRRVKGGDYTWLKRLERVNCMSIVLCELFCADSSLTDVQRHVYWCFVEDGELGIQYSKVRNITKPAMSAERLVKDVPRMKQNDPAAACDSTRKVQWDVRRTVEILQRRQNSNM